MLVLLWLFFCSIFVLILYTLVHVISIGCLFVLVTIIIIIIIRMLWRCPIFERMSAFIEDIMRRDDSFRHVLLGWLVHVDQIVFDLV